MAEYIKREALLDSICYETCGIAFCGATNCAFMAKVCSAPVADVAPVVRCKDCKHSTLPSELTRRYGKPGTRTCHNMHAPSNRRNVGSNDFCSYGERKDGES